jgi:hypothetical protein
MSAVATGTLALCLQVSSAAKRKEREWWMQAPDLQQAESSGGSCHLYLIDGSAAVTLGFMHAASG